MKYVFITPCQSELLVEFRERASNNVHSFVRQNYWIKWQQRDIVNGTGCKQWYLVVDTTVDKDNRLAHFAKMLCETEGYYPSSRICPHDWYYEDFENYFSKYK